MWTKSCSVKYVVTGYESRDEQQPMREQEGKTQNVTDGLCILQNKTKQDRELICTFFMMKLFSCWM